MLAEKNESSNRTKKIRCYFHCTKGFTISTSRKKSPLLHRGDLAWPDLTWPYLAYLKSYTKEVFALLNQRVRSLSTAPSPQGPLERAVRQHTKHGCMGGCLSSASQADGDTRSHCLSIKDPLNVPIFSYRLLKYCPYKAFNKVAGPLLQARLASAANLVCIHELGQYCPNF